MHWRHQKAVLLLPVPVPLSPYQASLNNYSPTTPSAPHGIDQATNSKFLKKGLLNKKIQSVHFLGMFILLTSFLQLRYNLNNFQ